jgi:hypothetical protein
MKIAKAFGSFSFVFLGLSLASSRAQPAAVQQLQNTQQGLKQQQPLLGIESGTNNAPELYPGENADVGPQRILKVTPSRTWFEVYLDSQAFFTGNALLTQHGAQSAGVFVNTAQFAVVPVPPLDLGAGKLTPLAGFRSQWYNYSLNTPPNLDFDAQTAFVAAKYRFDEKWELDGELDYTRLLGQSSYNEFYREWVPNLTVQRLFPLEDNLLASISWQSAYHFTDVPPIAFSVTPTDANNRLDNILTFSLSYQPAPKFIIQPYYSVGYTYYPRDPFSATSTSRNDLMNSLGLSVAYYFSPKVAIRTFISADDRASDNSIANYANYNVGVDVSLVIRF